VRRPICAGSAWANRMPINPVGVNDPTATVQRFAVAEIAGGLEFFVLFFLRSSGG
jgi:hypothetical protein